MQLTELLMVCCCWLSCLGTTRCLGGPFCWLLGAEGRGCDWAGRTPKFPLAGSRGPLGTPFEEEKKHDIILHQPPHHHHHHLAMESTMKHKKKTMQQFGLSTRGQNSTRHHLSVSKMLFSPQNVVKATPSADEKGDFFVRGRVSPPRGLPLP